MDREKVAGENFREGRMEVTFELWAERDMLSRFQRRFPPLSGEAISEDQNYSVSPFFRTETIPETVQWLFPYCHECRCISEFRWYHGHVVRPKLMLRAIFLSDLFNTVSIFPQGALNNIWSLTRPDIVHRVCVPSGNMRNSN